VQSRIGSSTRVHEVNDKLVYKNTPPPTPPLDIYLLVAFKLATASTVTDRIASAEALGM